MRRILLPAAVVAAWAAGATAQAQELGADLAGLIARVRTFNPQLQAAALDADAAAARIRGADSLDDPVFRISFEDLERRGGVAPGRPGAIFYTVEQEFPLWGKRDLRRQIAVSTASSARAKQEAVALELEARLKVAFARYYQTIESIEIAEDLRAITGTLARIAQQRVSQGLGAQIEPLRAEAEHTRSATSIQALIRERSAAAAQLNALLNRPAGAPLARPRALPPAPVAEKLVLADLVELAERQHPLLAADRADVAAADGARALADKAWYPDVTLGLSAVDRDRRLDGYEAMVSFRIPIQGDLKNAALQEAIARRGAAAARLQATLATLRGEVEAALGGLRAMQATERLIRDELLPQTEAAWRAALAGYEQGRAALDDVLDADRQRRGARLDAVRAAVEQRLLLAQLEQVTGGEL